MRQINTSLLSSIGVLLVLVSNWSLGVEISINQGRLSGVEESSALGRPFFAFRSIPFAEPPVEDLRFASPRPATNWEGVLDATKEGVSCAQAALGFDEGEEDCLHLSVYTPKLPESEGNATLPVLVWLHGGAFVTGSSKDYGPQLIMDKDIVFVVPQYRLGMFGFFSSTSQFAPGNYGMLDQVLALKWVQENVAKFGGDPDKVTLGGDCAGGISSVLHMMSPLSNGLFKGVISLSGSPLSYWSVHPRHMRLALLISKLVKCPAYDFQLLTKCFRERGARGILEAQMYALEARDLLVGNHKLAPAIQAPAHCHESSLFLEDHPLKLLERGDFTKVPVLLSVTRDVGSYLVDMALYEFIHIRITEDPEFLERLIGILVKETDIADYKEEEQKFKDYYFSDWDVKEVDTAIPGLTEMLGDLAFKAPILQLAKILSRSADTRLFRFDYEGGPKLFDVRHAESASKVPPIPNTAVSHGDELYFLFPYDKFTFTEEQRNVADQMLNIIDDFVNQREPLESWPLFTSDGLETTIMNSDGSITAGERFVSEGREDFLRYIFEKQHKKVLEALHNETLSEWPHDEF